MPVANLITLVGSIENSVISTDFAQLAEDLPETLAIRLLKVTRTIWDKAAQVKAKKANERRLACQKHIADIRLKLNALESRPQSLKSGPLEKNINIIFVDNPKDDMNDSQGVKNRKSITRTRCKVIQNLPADKQMIWMASLPPSAWAAGAMSNYNFDAVVKTLLEESFKWTLPAHGILTYIKDKYTALGNCESYEHLLQYQQRAIQPEVQRPSGESREIKNIFTNSPWHMIHLFPEPFQTIIMNSRQWKWERSQNLPTTGCWTSLFPKDYPQDFGLTIWGGHNDGYKLNDMLHMLPESQSQV